MKGLIVAHSYREGVDQLPNDRPSGQNEVLHDCQSLTAAEPASRRALMSRIGGWPKQRLYSRLN
jgi:hypothetical protein